jgi:CheY-like chemotaxis protein
MTSAAAMAPLTAIEISVDRPSMLIIDDDEKFLEKASEFFSDLGFSVETARTPEDAEVLLKQNNYQIVLTDVNFGRLSKTTGDNFVMDNGPLFGKAKRVVISAGEWLTPQRRNQLEEAGISFVEKATLPQRLTEIKRAQDEKWANDIQRVFEQETVPSIEKLTGRSIKFQLRAATAAAPALTPVPKAKAVISELATDSLKRTVINWLSTRGDLDEPVFAYGDRVYSANDLIGEVEADTAVGFEHVQMLLKEFEYSLEIDANGTGTYEDDAE